MLICSNCRNGLKEGDRYCRSCGAKYSPIPYAPQHNLMSCVYGPPYSVKCTCTACGYSYVDRALGSPHSKYFCPKCGAACSVGTSERRPNVVPIVPAADREMDEEEKEIDSLIDALLKERERQQKAQEGAPEGAKSAEEKKTDQ